MYRIKAAAEFIGGKISVQPQIALVLGSGLGAMAEDIRPQAIIPYEEIPDFPVSTVKSHAGRLVIGELEGKQVAAMQGRVHYYEGYTMEQVVFPARVLRRLGCEVLFATNAAGGINRTFNVGDFMTITDHINLLGTNPLVGPNDESLGTRFPDMSEPYDRGLQALAEKTANGLGLTLRKGVYVAVTGPSFETPAEINFFARIGCDAVGMSTVPEVIAANHMGMRVLGISCITNMAASILPVKLTGKEVIETAARVRPDFIRLVKGIVGAI
ncbi:MAG: purine-nucleoside phosphorylase [bacterium]|jgi:purine-nucleoside phosphorylase